MRDDIVKAEVFDYSQIVPGAFLQATVESATDRKSLILKVNSFVKGEMPLDHMAEMPVKMIPPKFSVGKEIKVRVFSVDKTSRQIIFTKKDSFMKEKCEIHDGSCETITTGEKIMGVAVGQTEHGWVIRSFGNIKGLLTFTEIKEAKKNIRAGTVVKAYVLFNKKKTGLALTFDKKKANKSVKDKKIVVTDQKSFENYLPDAEAAKTLKKTYKSLMSK